LIELGFYYKASGGAARWGAAGFRITASTPGANRGHLRGYDRLPGATSASSLDIALPHAMVGERLPNSNEHPHLEIEDDHRDVRKLLPDGAIEVLAATNGLGSVLVQTGRRSWRGWRQCE
jgi:hypothetical protein